MNLEQRQKRMGPIHTLEGLLAHAHEPGDMTEDERLHKERAALVEDCGDGRCCGEGWQ